jgi:hypothetical protein
MASMVKGRPVHHYAGYSDVRLKAEPFNLSEAEVAEVRMRLKDPTYDLKRTLEQRDRQRRMLAAQEEERRVSPLDPLPGENPTVSGDMHGDVREKIIEAEASGRVERIEQAEKEAEEARKRQAEIDERNARKADEEFEAEIEREADMNRKKLALRRELREEDKEEAEETERARRDVSTVPESVAKMETPTDARRAQRPAQPAPAPTQPQAPRLQTAPKPANG